ncbi:MAG: aminomethyltransferase family protein, partial [Amylibacter sp.]|nr:aminomethyltransferase family protein [Amylibacter sp.]
FPHEHRPAGRPAKTTPITPILAAEGAEFTVVNGWERLDYIKPSADFSETHGFHFNEAFDVVARDVKAVQTGVGLTEVNGFNRFELSGNDVRGFIDRMFCGFVTKKSGRVGLGYLLNLHGNIKGEATIANLPDGRIWYGSAAASEFHDMDWLTQNIDANEDVRVRNLTNDHTILLLAGPKSRDVLSAASRGDWSKEAFPWLSVREAFVGIAPAVVMAVSFSGELAYEIHVPNNQLYAAYLALRAAGAPHDLHLFGARAVESMRLEKGYRHWKADLITEFNPFESDLSRFVKMDKEFIGKAALEKMQANGPRQKFVTLTIDCTHAPAHPGASVVKDGKVVGTIASADWGHRVGKNIAMAFVDPDVSDGISVEVIGVPVPAQIVEPCLYDPETSLPRS